MFDQALHLCSGMNWVNLGMVVPNRNLGPVATWSSNSEYVPGESRLCNPTTIYFCLVCVVPLVFIIFSGGHSSHSVYEETLLISKGNRKPLAVQELRNGNKTEQKGSEHEIQIQAQAHRKRIARRRMGKELVRERERESGAQRSTCVRAELKEERTTVNSIVQTPNLVGHGLVVVSMKELIFEDAGEMPIYVSGDSCLSSSALRWKT
ncbi:uncharacterized protein FOMMEDRAFT_160547 [Fomitiporia mediterranea MF3/22]|uniref:uncharacterized protein n=1 Tax=Fomitiporia mediterranea (strain MF3/22) TaxID=694068 RepID=UPI0004409A85|nr:uncharacterized protein FOMMEDRAFT_160547 [Fomitiporia mediterranea MF3/22]EJC99489.1 hypothetical protein FOMMEDRAFT_160547 [Fomitiporia mediterranea MF3/22]